MLIMKAVEKYGTYREISVGHYAGPCPRCGGAMRFRIKVAENSGKCISCDFAITCTSENETDFNTDKMSALISDAFSLVTSQSPKGAEKWLSDHRPDVTAHLVQVGKAVDAAFEARDEAAVRKAVDSYIKYHQRAWQIFNERPPVIERQEAISEATESAAEK